MSRGQLPRNPIHFPRMNDRAGRRRYRRALARAHRFARARNGIPYFYNRGGIVRSGTPVRATLALDECVLTGRDGTYQCARTDPAHTATDRHRLWARPVNYLAALRAALAKADEWERQCLNCGTPLRAHIGIEGRECPGRGLVTDMDTGELIADLGPATWFEAVPEGEPTR